MCNVCNASVRGSVVTVLRRAKRIRVNADCFDYANGQHLRFDKTNLPEVLFFDGMGWGGGGGGYTKISHS